MLFSISDLVFFLNVNIYVFFGVLKNVFIGNEMILSIKQLSSKYFFNFVLDKLEKIPSGNTTFAIPPKSNDLIIHSKKSDSTPEPPNV